MLLDSLLLTLGLFVIMFVGVSLLFAVDYFYRQLPYEWQDRVQLVLGIFGPFFVAWFAIFILMWSLK